MDTITTSPKKKNLAENCFRLTIGNLGKGLLQFHPGKRDPDQIARGELIPFIGKEGSFTLKNGPNGMYISYSVKVFAEPRILEIWFLHNAHGTTQEIELAETPATFGVRLFFICCECHNNAGVLYKPADQELFKCRKCSRIIYESQRLNRKTMGGVFSQMHKLIKLAKKEERVNRRFYGNKFTRPMQSFLKWKAKYGLGVSSEVLAFVKLQAQLAAQGEIQTSQ